MSVFTLEELQKMDKNEQLDIGKLTDQSEWVKGYQSEEFEKASPDVLKLCQENIRLKAEIEKLKKRHGAALIKNDDLDLENYELKKQVDELKAKIPNNCVVLSKEEWDKLMGDTYTSKELDEIVAYKERVKAREVAQNILTKLADDFDVAGMDVEYPLNRVKIYAKQFGVEVK